MTKQGSHATPPDPTPAAAKMAMRRGPLILVGVFVALIAVAFVLAIISMWRSLYTEAGQQRFDLFTGQLVTYNADTFNEPEGSHIAITATALDEEAGTVTLRISGHRNCTDCLTHTLMLYALDPNPEDWWGLPPSQSIELPSVSSPFTMTATLPVQGFAARYPLDNYTLLLGAALQETLPDKSTRWISLEEMEERGVRMALSEQLPRFTISAEPKPMSIPPQAQKKGLFTALEITYDRPVYLPLIALMLTILIAVSATMSSTIRDAQEVFIGVGTLVLGIWGIQTIAVQTKYQGLTIVDVALASVIMLVLLIVTVRGALVWARRPPRGKA